MKKRTWARKAELVTLWDSTRTEGRRELAEAEGLKFNSLMGMVSNWRNDGRAQEAKKAPRRLCKTCGELKTLDQFELTRKVRECIACAHKQRGTGAFYQEAKAEYLAKTRSFPNRHEPQAQDALIADYRAILTSDPNREKKREALAANCGVKRSTLVTSVMRWEAVRRQSRAPKGLDSAEVTDWLFALFADLEIDKDMENAILAHRVRYERGIQNG